MSISFLIMKLKWCETGQHHVPSLWKAKGKTYLSACKDCWNRKKPKERRVTSKSIKPLSEKRASQMNLYRKNRDLYFKDHPVCEFPGCNSTKITLHHMGGRIGDLLHDMRYFKSLCWPHHQWVELNPEEAKKLKLSVSRLSIEE